MFNSPTHTDDQRGQTADVRQPVVPFGFDGPVNTRAETIPLAQLQAVRDLKRVQADLASGRSAPAPAVQAGGRHAPVPAAKPGVGADQATDEYSAFFGTSMAAPRVETASLVVPAGASVARDGEGLQRFALGGQIGKGAEKQAVELQFLDGRSATAHEVIALFPLQRADDVFTPTPGLDPIAREVIRHKHYKEIAQRAPGIGPEYHGMVTIDSAAKERPQLGHVFERMDSSLDIMMNRHTREVGGGVTFGGFQVGAADLLSAGMLLTSRYREASSKGLAFMDPKPANFGVRFGAPDEVDAPGKSSFFDRITQSAKGFLSRIRVIGSDEPTKLREPLIQDVKFLDHDSFRPRAYDPVRDAGSVPFTPAYIPPAAAKVFMGGSQGQAFQEAQQTDQSATWIAGATLFSLATGRFPQEQALDQLGDAHRAAGKHFDEMGSWMQMRMSSAGYKQDFETLDGLVEKRKLSTGFAALVKDSLKGTLDIDTFQRRAATEMRALGVRPPFDP